MNISNIIDLTLPLRRQSAGQTPQRARIQRASVRHADQHFLQRSAAEPVDDMFQRRPQTQRDNRE
jgi:hypothetical protein